MIVFEGDDQFNTNCYRKEERTRKRIRRMKGRTRRREIKRKGEGRRGRGGGFGG